MKRVFALGFGLMAAVLLAAPVAVLAGGAPPPTVLAVPHNGPSVLAVPYGDRPSVLGVPQAPAAPVFRHHHPRPLLAAPQRQPVWVHPQWAWNGWQWVWVPGYWAW